MTAIIPILIVSAVNTAVGVVFLRRYDEIVSRRERGKDFTDKALARIKLWEQENINTLCSKEMGEWLYMRDINKEKNKPTFRWRDSGACGYVCPSCNRHALIKTHYCPNCGAKMEVDE